jgi:ribosomal protein S18 acetylase RimI-like enzyme
MKVKIRRSSQDDLDAVYNLHTKCFKTTDQWYKSAIRQYLDKGIVVVCLKTNMICGVMLQGTIIPCNKNFKLDGDGVNNEESEKFEPINFMGTAFMESGLNRQEIYGIVMICVDPEYRGKGLAQKLIEKHFADNKDRVVCLNTRRSNVGAYTLYKKMGYNHIAYIKHKYFLPNEDSIFMIKDLLVTKSE